jgi:hypothetical protein
MILKSLKDARGRRYFAIYSKAFLKKRTPRGCSVRNNGESSGTRPQNQVVFLRKGDDPS